MNIIFNINDVERLRGELRLANEYIEHLEEQVTHLKDRIAFYQNPQGYYLQKGHSSECIRVKAPLSLYLCNCGRSVA